MSKYTLFGQEIEFSAAADRYYNIIELYSKASAASSIAFKIFYDECGNISKVLDEYLSTIHDITEWSIVQLYDDLASNDIFDVSRKSFEKSIWDLSGAEEYYDCIAELYNNIIEEQAEAEAYRAMRKETRGRVIGGGIGLGGAIKGMATAGAMNAVSGIGHSIVNSIGNLRSSISASSSKAALYQNENTFEILNKGLDQCVKDIFIQYMDFVNEYKENEGEEICFDGSCYDLSKSDTLLENAEKYPEKRKELLVKAFRFCPYNYNLYEYIFTTFEEEQGNIFNIAKNYNIDLSDNVEQALSAMYTEEAQNSTEEALLVRDKMKELMELCGTTESYTFNNLECDCLRRIYNSYPFDCLNSNNKMLDEIKRFEALDTNKAGLIQYFGIWELAKDYNVEFSDDDKEKIISNICDHAEDEDNIDYKAVIARVHYVMEQIGLHESEALDDYEYSILEEIAEDYSELPVGESSNVIDEIRQCKVSDNTKKAIIHDYEIWELASEYDVELSLEDKLNIVGKAHQNLIESGSTNETIADKLNIIFKELWSVDDCKKLSLDIREALFEIMSGVGEEKLKLNVEVSSLNAEKVAKIRDSVEEYISSTGITFMSSSLTYEADSLDEEVANLKFCQMAEDEVPILIYDDHPVADSSRHGFCITNKRLIANQEDCEKLEMDINDITFFDKKWVLSSSISVYTRNSTIKEIKAGNLSEIGKLVKCLNDIILVGVHSLGLTSGTEETFRKEYNTNCLKCIEENAFLIDYLGVSEKAMEISNNAKIALDDGDSQNAPSIALDSNSTQSLTGNTNTIDSNSTPQLSTENTDNYLSETNSSVTPQSSAVNTNNYVPATNNNVTPQTERNHLDKITDDYYSGGLEYFKKGIHNLSDVELNHAITALTINHNTTGLLPIGSQMFYKKIGKANAAYAHYSDFEKPLVMCDRTVFGSAKEGYVVTDKNIFVNTSGCKNTSIPMDSICGINKIRESGLTYIYIATNSNWNYKIDFRSDEVEANGIVAFLTDLIQYITGRSFAPSQSVNSNPNITSNSNPTADKQIKKWICTCGTVNADRFCETCGLPSNTGIELWVCKCGNENKGDFCTKCGTPKSNSMNNT